MGSITRWIGDFKAGDDQAIQPLWDRYFTTLVERARTKLRAIGSSRAVNDEEDVALAHSSLYTTAFARAGSPVWWIATTSGGCCCT